MAKMQQQPTVQAPRTNGHVIHWARLYDTVVRIIALGREAALRRETVALAELQPGQQILDVGCGTGTLVIAAAMSQPAITAHGIDPAPEMIDRARQKAGLAGVEATFDVGIIEKLPFEDRTFDTVLSSLMLHHLPLETLRAGLAETMRVLKPGGRLVVIDFPGPGPLLHRIGRLFTGGRSPKRHVDQVLELLESLGFTRVERGRPRPGFLCSIVARRPT